jgi:hypothetical protein
MEEVCMKKRSLRACEMCSDSIGHLYAIENGQMDAPDANQCITTKVYVM